MLLLKYLPETAAFLLFILISSQVGGAPAIVAEFALTGLLVAVHFKTFLETIVRWWPLMLTGVLATASAFWSSVPDVSLRYGAQLLFTIFLGIFLARLMSPKRWVSTFMVSTFVFCILCILSRRQGISDVGMVLIGLTGSKNAMSYEGSLLFMSALAVLLMGGLSNWLRVLALLSLPLAAGIIFITNSATGALLTVGGAGMLGVLWLSERMSPGGRLVTVVLGAAALAPILFLAPEISAFMDHFLYDTLNKDPTLTGRTILWARADELVAHRPLLGYGYQAIWMGDSFDTIGLKRLTGIEDGRLFHFHNTFRQVAVDTGLVGLMIFAGTMIASVLKGVAQLLLRPNVATSFFFTIFVVALFRAFTDTVLQPFLIHTVLLYTCCVYAYWRPQTAQQEQPASPMSSRFAPAGRPA